MSRHRTRTNGYVSRRARALGLAVALASGLLGAGAAAWELGPEQLVMAAGEAITVPGYSVPSRADWNADGVPDLVIGEGGGGFPGKVRVYLGSGDPANPIFTDWFYVQADGADLEQPASGCLGVFPRVVEWNGDQRQDLLLGTSAGSVLVYRNLGTDAEPVFVAADTVKYGEISSQNPIDVGYRATPVFVDWNGDELSDLVVGALDGRIHLYINAGSSAEPYFPTVDYAEDSSAVLVVPSGRSSPEFADVTGDALADLVVGNTEGQLLLYANTGEPSAPAFAGYTQVDADGQPLDLPGTPRSRPAVCDWNLDGTPDVLLGCGCGRIHLHIGEPITAAPTPAPPLVRLLAPWPNPFNPRVTIAFELERPERVTVSVYALDGSLVRRLSEASWSAGRHTLTWDGRDVRKRACAAGVYVVRLTTPAGVAQRRATLVR